MSIAEERQTGVSAPQEETPYYARRNEKGIYVWDGEELPSVTTILGAAPGQHLMLWYAKMAAQKAASHLFQAGIPIPEGDEKLADFCASLRPRDLTDDQAHAEVMNWSTVMREAERYRDHKARIGSVTHHAIYEHAIGLRAATDDLEDYCRNIAIRILQWTNSRGETVIPTEAMVCEVAHSALPYVLSAFEWIEKAQPDWEMIGQEAVVVRPDPGDGSGYAGTVDFTARFNRSTWEKHWDWKWPALDRVQMTGDFKTSNSLAKSVQMQVEAYAHADFIGLISTGEKFDVPNPDAIMALHIGPHASMSDVSDEYGTLESRAKVIGAKPYTWDRSEETFQAFLGLCRYVRWLSDIPTSQQQQKREPKEPKLAKTDRRTCPF
jgi:hypothetical protein